jgi:histidinol-phosphate phosphatase family protein
LRRYVLLDRDGTLIRDVGYPHRLEDYELLAGVAPALQRLAGAGFRLAVVTNQSGIGRGYFGFADYERFHARLLADLAAAGVAIDATFVCPHAPDAGCECRKPAPGLLWRARDELGADLASSWLIGDTERDVEAVARGPPWHPALDGTRRREQYARRHASRCGRARSARGGSRPRVLVVTRTATQDSNLRAPSAADRRERWPTRPAWGGDQALVALDDLPGARSRVAAVLRTCAVDRTVDAGRVAT